MTTSHSDYFLRLTGEASVRALAEKAGLVQATLNRQLNGTSALSVQTVVAICRAYGLALAPVFVHVGFITEEEARAFSGPLSLASISDLELSKEMLRRVAAGTASTAITEPVDEQLIEDVLREVENARAEGRPSEFGLAADARPDRTPGEFEDAEHEDRPEL